MTAITTRFRGPGAEDNVTSADSARTTAADNPPRKAYRVPRWPLAFMAAPAAVAVWSGWVGLGGLAGFGLIHPLPGIVPGLHLNTAITLPIGVEAYGAYALRAWLTLPRRGRDGSATDRARRFARGSALAAFGLGMLGQVVYHLLAAAHVTRAPWPITALVACLPVVSLALGAGLAHMLGAAAAELDDDGAWPGPGGPPRLSAGGPVVEVPAGTAVRVAPGGTRADLAAVKAARLGLESELLARAARPPAGPAWDSGPQTAARAAWERGEWPPQPDAQKPPAGERPPTAPAGAVSPSPGRSAPPAAVPGALPAKPAAWPAGPPWGSGDASPARTRGPARNAGPDRATVPPLSVPPARPAAATVPPARPAAADGGPVPGPVSPMPQGAAAARAAYAVSVAAGEPKSARQLAADHGISRRQAGKITNEDGPAEDVPRPLSLVRNTGAETTGARR